MLEPKDPFERFREKKALEKLQAKMKGDSGPIYGGKKKTDERPALGGDKAWIY